MNDEQKKFVWDHYVNYSDPEDMVAILEWLYDVALDYEYKEAEAKKANAKPKKKRKK
jgi:hypothetical protein